MSKIKPSIHYHITVEGEDEKWYFEHLKELINNCEDSKFKIDMKPKVEKSPWKYVKTRTFLFKEVAFHIYDYESNDDIHKKQFENILNEIKVSKKEKNVTIKLGYTNFTFELWMILHKEDCNTKFSFRTQYLDAINKNYNTNFQFLKEYKKEKNFKRILERIELSDIINAINRAKQIKENNKNNNCERNEYKGFEYYIENPDLTVHLIIEKILKDCKIIK